MSVTVQSVYDRVSEVLLETGGFVLGVFTAAQFLNSLSVVLLDLSQRTTLDKRIYTQRIVSGTSEYVGPDDIMETHLCFVGGKLVEKVAEADLTQGKMEWKSQTGTPRQWHEDNLDIKHFVLFPKPDFSGTAMSPTYGQFFPTRSNVTIVGPAAPSQTTWALADTIDDLPRSFGPYLVYGILEQIFSAEGETRDDQRALYCRTRFSECIALADAIARAELFEGEDED